MQVGKQKPTNWSAKALLPWAHNALYWWNMHFPFMAAHSNLYVMFNVNVNKCTKTPSWMLLLNSLQELLFMMYIPDFCNLSLLRTQDRFPLNSSSLSFGLYKSALFLDLFFFWPFFFFLAFLIFFQTWYSVDVLFWMLQKLVWFRFKGGFNWPTNNFLLTVTRSHHSFLETIVLLLWPKAGNQSYSIVWRSASERQWETITQIFHGGK